MQTETHFLNVIGQSGDNYPVIVATKEGTKTAVFLIRVGPSIIIQETDVFQIKENEKLFVFDLAVPTSFDPSTNETHRILRDALLSLEGQDHMLD